MRKRKFMTMSWMVGGWFVRVGKGKKDEFFHVEGVCAAVIDKCVGVSCLPRVPAWSIALQTSYRVSLVLV